MNAIKCIIWAILIVIVSSAIGAVGSLLLGGNLAVAAYLGFAIAIALSPLATRYVI